MNTRGGFGAKLGDKLLGGPLGRHCHLLIASTQHA